MKIELFDGTVIQNVYACVNEYLESRWFEFYDKPPDGNPNTITPADVAITSALNSRANRNTIYSVMERKVEIQRELRKIQPRTSSLLNNFCELKNKVQILFELCLGSSVGLSTASKILHRKRPLLIPIMDRRIQKTYRSRDPIKIMEAFQLDLIINHEKLQRIIQKRRSQLTDINPLRLLEALIWQNHGGNR